ncbi:MAG: patatin-like phospholipase family protein [Pseudomonadota bacterium]
MGSLLERAVGREHQEDAVAALAVDPIAQAMAMGPKPAAAANQTTAPVTHPEQDRFRTLVLDGGGINGLAQVKALAALEKETGKPITDHFEMMVGTSTGGLIALAMAAPHPDDPSRPLMTATELVAFYEEQGPVIFGTRNKIDRGADWNEKPLEDFLKSKFGDMRMSDARIPVMVSTMDNDKGEAVWLHNLDMEYGAETKADPLMWQAARATSAAPTKFKPVEVDMGNGRTRSLIDGGVFANMPAIEANTVAKVLANGRQVEMLSIGTGAQRFSMTSDKVASTGALGWAIDIFKGKSPIREMAEQGKETSADQLLKLSLGDRYHRWEIPLIHEHGRKFSPTGNLDDATPGNIAKLKFVGEQFVARHWDKVTRLADSLAPDRTPGDAPAMPDRAALRERLDQADPKSPGLLARIFGFGSKNSKVLASGPEMSRETALANSTSPAAIMAGCDQPMKRCDITPAPGATPA